MQDVEIGEQEFVLMFHVIAESAFVEVHRETDEPNRTKIMARTAVESGASVRKKTGILPQTSLYAIT